MNKKQKNIALIIGFVIALVLCYQLAISNTLQQNEFILEGNYNAIIQLIHQLEQKTKFGEVINLHFEKKKNFRSGTFYLQVTILLQSFG